MFGVVLVFTRVTNARDVPAGGCRSCRHIQTLQHRPFEIVALISSRVSCKWAGGSPPLAFGWSLSRFNWFLWST
jgi:hypothetical protein